jgi:hypothetical protein
MNQIMPPRKTTNSDAIRLILGRLDKPSFTKFSFELFGQTDFNKFYEYQKTYFIKKFGENIIEQHYQERKEQRRQGYDLIIPFLEPFDLFKNIRNIDIEIPELNQLFKYYTNKVNRRRSKWQFWTDGEYVIPSIKFITNYSGLDENQYEENIFPKFEKLLNKFDFDSQIMIGSLDSFFKKNPEGTCNAFNLFIKKYSNEISIHLIENNKFKIQGHVSEKYFTSGVLKSSLSPCEPLVSFNINDKTQILDEFEFLLNNNTKENELELFLKKNFKYVFGSNYDRIETQLWLKFPELDNNNKNRRLDIFLRNSIARDWELFELKKASNIVRSTNTIPTFTSEFTSALQQIKNYSKILNQDNVKRVLANDGIEYYSPELRLVIGKKPDIPLEKWRWLKKSNENDLKIITYDELYDGLKSRLEFHNKNNLFNLYDYS